VNAEKAVWICHAGCGKGHLRELARRAGWPWPWNGSSKREVARYDYRDAEGRLLFQVVRFEPKEFRHYDPNKNAWSTKGIARVPYRLPELLSAMKAGEIVYVVEGEKDVESLRKLNIAATCNPSGCGGGGVWKAFAEQYFDVGDRVALLGDADEPGQALMLEVARRLLSRGCEVRAVDLGYEQTKNHGRDVSDWISEGHTREELQELAESAQLLDSKALKKLTRETARSPSATKGETASTEKPFSLTADEIHETDLGNARRLVRLYGQDIRYCHVWRQWYIWDGSRWRPDTSGEIFRRAKDTVASMYKEASEELEEKRRKALAAHAMKSELAARIEAMVRLAESEPGIPVQPDELDANPWLLNCANGTLNLRTCELQAHRREDMLTICSPVPYDPQAYSELWYSFLARALPDPEIVLFLQRAVGYSLTANTGEEVFFLLYGNGRNGKSKFLGAIAYVLGDYASTARPETFMQRDARCIPEDLAALEGRRFVQSIETPEGGRFSEALVKQLCGGDTIAARKLYKGTREFKPVFKLWLATNSKPIVSGQDVAMWERILLVPFTVYIQPEERDTELSEKLKAEGAAILAWAVEGCREWQAHRLQVPDAVKAATRNYKSESDVLAEFLDTSCETGPGLSATAKDLYSRYRRWTEENGERTRSKEFIARRLQEKGFNRITDRKGAYTWTGIGLRGEF
jgi:putative DNA primase/helicase